MKKSLFWATMLLMLAGLVLPVVALPGIQNYMQDLSGQYVYYRDYSFEYEAYVGFLCYDEEQYGLRYYSPQHPVSGTSAAAVNAGVSSKGGQSAIPYSIDILFRVDPEKSVTEITGEQFLSEITSEDTFIVNYLHDLVYELSQRRRNLTPAVVTDKTEVRDDFPQFGGSVKMKYSFDIPIFNLEEIISGDGKPVFDLVTVGRLASSSDESFWDFEGFPSPMADKKRNFVSSVKKPKNAFEYNSQKILLDEQWMQVADNMCLLGDVAVVVLSEFVPSEQTKAGGDKAILDALVREYSLGTTNAYVDWGNRKVSRTKTSATVTTRRYLAEDNAVSNNFYVIEKNKDGVFCIVNLTVFEDAYRSNKSYFDAILKSFDCK